MKMNLFDVRPNDRRTLNALVDLLAASYDTEEVERFLEDFARWHRAQHRRVSQREYEAARAALQEWQDAVDELPEVPIQ